MDYVKQLLETRGIPITRKNYFAWNSPGIDPGEPLEAELEMDLPEEVQLPESEWAN